ncbi:MAG: ABC transporter substrate-binding protein [Anaerolineae bacterium]|nr:ABC transporter substrate-binding protein [Anaerolineae bacterium]
MMDKPYTQHFRFPVIVVLFFVIAFLPAACGKAQPSTKSPYTIGILNESEALLVTFEGFKEGMAKLGYVEGEEVVYIYNGVMGVDSETIDQEIENLMAQDVDLLFAMGTAPAVRARPIVEETGMPVIFTPVINPVAEGIVDSLSRPGVNMSGIQTGTSLPKTIEWLLAVAPATNVYIPYHPDDAVTVTSISTLRGSEAGLGVDIIADEVDTPQEVVAALENLPEDTVVLFVPFPTLEPGLDDYAATALKHHIAIGTYHPVYMRNGILVNLSIDPYAIGLQAAQMVDQVIRGVAPADLPVETADSFLTFNQVTAKAIGLEIPNDILRLADTVIY